MSSFYYKLLGFMFTIGAGFHLYDYVTGDLSKKEDFILALLFLLCSNNCDTIAERKRQ